MKKKPSDEVRKHLDDKPTRAYLYTLGDNPLPISQDPISGGWKLNQRGWALIKGVESSTVTDKPKEDA